MESKLRSQHIQIPLLVTIAVSLALIIVWWDTEKMHVAIFSAAALMFIGTYVNNRLRD